MPSVVWADLPYTSYVFSHRYACILHYFREPADIHAVYLQLLCLQILCSKYYRRLYFNDYGYDNYGINRQSNRIQGTNHTSGTQLHHRISYRPCRHWSERCHQKSFIQQAAFHAGCRNGTSQISVKLIRTIEKYIIFGIMKGVFL